MKPSPVPASVAEEESFQLAAPSSQLPVWPFPQVTSLPVCWLDVWLVVRQLSDLYVLFNIIMAGRFAAGTRCPMDSMPQLLVPPVGCAKCEKLSTLQAAPVDVLVPHSTCFLLRVPCPCPCTCPVSMYMSRVPCPCPCPCPCSVSMWLAIIVKECGL